MNKIIKAENFNLGSVSVSFFFRNLNIFILLLLSKPAGTTFTVYSHSLQDYLKNILKYKIFYNNNNVSCPNEWEDSMFTCCLLESSQYTDHK